MIDFSDKEMNFRWNRNSENHLDTGSSINETKMDISDYLDHRGREFKILLIQFPRRPKISAGVLQNTFGRGIPNNNFMSSQDPLQSQQ